MRAPMSRPLLACFNKASLFSTSATIHLKKLPGRPTEKITVKDFLVLGAKIVVGIQGVIVLADFISYAVKPSFRDGYRLRRPGIADGFDTVLGLEKTQCVLSEREVVEKAQQARHKQQ